MVPAAVSIVTIFMAIGLGAMLQIIFKYTSEILISTCSYITLQLPHRNGGITYFMYRCQRPKGLHTTVRLDIHLLLLA